VKRATEYGFLCAVLRLAKLCGWRSLHVRPGRTLATGWRTPLMGSGAVGWPDCLFVRGNRLVICELKTEGGRLTAAQRQWLSALRQVPGVEVYEFRPRDWERIEEILA
jgi:hypothetical protein